MKVITLEQIKEQIKEQMKGFQKHGKDIDREILLNIEDNKDFLKACSINKYFYNEVCNDMFFKNRLMRTYSDTLKYKKIKTDEYDFKSLSWKQYFLQVIYYIDKLKEDFQYDYTYGNFKDIYLYKLSELYRRVLVIDDIHDVINVNLLKELTGIF